MTDLKQDAHACFALAVEAAKPFERTRQALAQRSHSVVNASKVHVLAAGKAALDMVDAALLEVPATKRGHIIAVTNYENERSIEGCIVYGANHPVPDAAGERAACAIERAALDASADDLVVCLISGGASALLPAPVEGVSLADKIATTELLLKSGADITAFNTVRKALSRLKGGGLARAVYPAQCISLILSDVPHDDLQIIASGPTVQPNASTGSARAVIDAHGLLEELPDSVGIALTKAPPDPSLNIPQTDNVLIGSNAISLATLADALTARGYRVNILSKWLEGTAEDAAKHFIDALIKAPQGKQAIIAGGETSVHVTGTGSGGRNQHMALAFALKLGACDRGFAFLSGGTDGRDGPTDAAGGLVTNATLAMSRQNGTDLSACLDNNDSYNGLNTVDGLLITGPTGTNVADLQILLLE